MKYTLEFDQLMRAAQQRTGLDGFGFGVGCETLVEGWQRLIEAINGSQRYDNLGVDMLREEFSIRLTTELQLEQDLARFPEIRDVPIVAPVFIVNFGRTGSTFLHNLMAQDERARTPALWELWSPSPPPSSDQTDCEARIRAARERIELMEIWTPDVLKIHPLVADQPDECQWLVTHGTHQALQHIVPPYWEWLKAMKPDRMHQLMERYRLQIQRLQLFRRGKYWLSKSMSHLHYLPALLKVFPHATVICLHRDPRRVVPSLCSLYRSIGSGFVRNGADGELGELALDVFVDGMDRLMTAKRTCQTARFLNVQFEELVADPIGTVRRIAEAMGSEYTESWNRRCHAYLACSDAAPRYRHDYALENFGLTEDFVMTRTAAYCRWLDQIGLMASAVSS